MIRPTGLDTWTARSRCYQASATGEVRMESSSGDCGLTCGSTRQHDPDTGCEVPVYMTPCGSLGHLSISHTKYPSVTPINLQTQNTNETM